MSWHPQAEQESAAPVEDEAGSGGVLMVSLFVAAAGSAGLFYTLERGDVEVPALVGSSLIRARSLAHERGFKVLIAGDKKIDPLVARGAVATQTPLARAKLARGGTIMVVLSAGGGQTKAAPPAKPPSPSSPPIAIPRAKRAPPSVTPAAVKAPPSVTPAAVKAPPSAPPAPVVKTAPAGMVTVIKVTGVRLRYARSRLKAAGLAVGQVTYASDEDHMEEYILKQKPRPGQQVPRGSAVDLVVNKHDG